MPTHIPLSNNRLKNLRANAKRNTKCSGNKLKDELNTIASQEGFSSWRDLINTHNEEKVIPFATKPYDKPNSHYVSWGHILGSILRKHGISQPKNVIQIAVHESKDPIRFDDDYINHFKMLADLPLEMNLTRNDPYYSYKDEDSEPLSVVSEIGFYRVLDIDSSDIQLVMKSLQNKFFQEIHNSILEIWINGERIGTDEYWLVDEQFGDIYPKPNDKLPASAYLRIGDQLYKTKERL